MENKNLVYLAGGLAALAVVVGGYFVFTKDESATPPQRVEERPTVPTPVTIETTEATESGGKTVIRKIEVSGDEFKFNPSTITLAAGERVKITFKNTGNAPHNLRIEELGIGSQTIAGGQTDSFEFTAPAAGRYTFFCSVAGHREAGMEGELTVE